MFRKLYPMNVTMRVCVLTDFCFSGGETLLVTQKHNFNVDHHSWLLATFHRQLPCAHDIQLGTECKFESRPDQDDIL